MKHIKNIEFENGIRFKLTELENITVYTKSLIGITTKLHHTGILRLFTLQFFEATVGARFGDYIYPCRSDPAEICNSLYPKCTCISTH